MYNEPSAQLAQKQRPTIQFLENTDHTIMFGNGSTESATSQLSITPTFPATVLPINHCPNNLLAVKALTDNNCTTTFKRDICIIDPPEETNFSPIIIQRDPDTHLYHANMEDIHSLLTNVHEFYCNNKHLECNKPIYVNSGAVRRSTDYSLQQRVIDLHERMDHVSCDFMCAAVTGDNPAWIGTNLTAREIHQVFSRYTCITCAATKRNLDPPTDRSKEQRRNWKPGECFSCDPAVKINPIGFEGSDCFFLFKDLATGYLHAILSDSKKSSAFIDAFKKVLDFYVKYKCHPTAILRTDSESIFLSQEVTHFLHEKMIELQTSAPERRFQVSVERDMQTVFKGLSTVLHGQQFLRLDLWPAALLDFIDKKNRSPNSRCSPLSPHQVITQQSTKLDNQFMFKFGEVVIVGTPKRLRNSKLDPRNEIGIYIGQDLGMVDAHRIYFPHNNTFRNRGSVSKIDVTEDKLKQWFTRRMESKQPVYEQIMDAYHDLFATIEEADVDFTANNDDVNATIIPNQTNEETTINNSTLPSLTDEELIMFNDPSFKTLLRKFIQALAPTTFVAISSEEQQHMVNSPISGESVTSSSVPPKSKRMRTTKNEVQPTHSMSLRKRGTHANSVILQTHYNEETHESVVTIHCNLVTTSPNGLDIADDTPSLKKALASSDREEWIKAIRKEIYFLLENTLKPINVSTMDSSQYIRIRTTMQLKRKRDSKSGNIEKYKARECARGDLIAYDDEDNIITFSPTIHPLTFATILQVATIKRLSKKTADHVAAFLNQLYPTDKRPLILRLDPIVAEVCELDPLQDYSLAMYLYGLPDASRAHYDAYSKHLKLNGYKVSAFDPCLFYCVNAQEQTYIVIHVDDTFIFSNTDTAIQRFIDIMQSKFEITVNDDADTYLGVHLVEDKTTGSIMMHQPKLIQSLLEMYEAEIKSPPDIATTKEYQKLLGTLMYITKSRPDIQASISFAATHSKNPTREHYIQLLKLVEYIKQTKDEGLIINSYEDQSNQTLQLYCHVDASYLSHEDSKSQTGYTLSFGKTGCFYAKSSKQPLVATSSTHAEARALFTLLQDIIYVVSICQELSIEIKLPVIVYEDNFPVVQLSNNLAPRAKKCKHFLMLINYIKEQVEAGIIKIEHVDTDENLADILTKILTGSLFFDKAKQILGTPPVQCK